MRKKEKLEIFNISRNVEIYLSANDFDGILSLLLENLFWRIIKKLVSKLGCYHKTFIIYFEQRDLCVELLRSNMEKSGCKKRKTSLQLPLVNV